ncbi:cdc42 effector protein 3 [Megalops cyprinoides]|uniref:cdc42 effector protein 3 n=1 Tax=Megalops cyprinoides TaxID=118141 RepID=UPI0018650FE1|nr:cdc42 effector protein 3 [Megalops cyprinoides]XP_036402903.1 cdc42 effector protein 3 [Megalops cyprinoides]
MPAKTPIYLKSTNSKKGKKCRLRDILSPDMISPPLGDFRHTVHIGKGGERDAFGDMSFLQGKFELLPGKERVPPQYTAHSEFLRANSASDASFTETPSPVLKNAISLPAIGGSQALTLPLISTVAFPSIPDPFDAVEPPPPSLSEETEELELLQTDTLLLSLDIFNSHSRSSTQTSSKPSFLLDELEELKKPTEKKKPSENGKVCNGENGYNSPPPCYSNGSSNGIVRHVTSTKPSECYTGWLERDSVEDSRICDFEFELSKGKSLSQDSISKITGSLLSLELDLGPSILDDVLNIMDRPKTGDNQ